MSRPIFSDEQRDTIYRVALDQAADQQRERARTAALDALPLLRPLPTAGGWVCAHCENRPAVALDRATLPTCRECAA